MSRILTIIFAIVVLLGSMVMIGLLNTQKYSGSDGLFRSCRYSEVTGKRDECFWLWDRTRNDPSQYF